MNAQRIRPEIGWAMAVLMGCLVWGANARAADRSVDVALDKIATVTLDFPVDSYKLANPNLARVELDAQRTGLNITGVKRGKTDLIVNGPGGVSTKVAINVIEDIDEVVKAVRNLLEEVPEVDILKTSDKLIIKGDVSHIGHWKQVRKVAAMFPAAVANMAAFIPVPEMLMDIQQAFKDAGFVVVDAKGQDPQKPMEIKTYYSGNTLYVKGQVYNRRQIDTLKGVLAGQRWLAVQDVTANEKVNPDEDLIPVSFGVSIDSSMLEVGVSFLVIDEVNFDERKANLLKAGLLLVNDVSMAAQGEFGEGDHSSTFSGGYRVGVGLEGALKWMSGEQATKSERVGHITFANDSEGSSYRSGGTIKVRVAGQTSGDLKDIPYGLEIKVKGYHENATNIYMTLDTSLSLPQPMGADYDIKEEKLQNIMVTCPIGNTLILGGSRWTDDSSSTEGVPILRKIPVINWFASEKAKGKRDLRVIILVSPQKGPGTYASMPVSDQTKTVLGDRDKSTDELKMRK